MLGAAEQCHRLPRKVKEWSSPESFKTILDVFLCLLLQVTLSWQGFGQDYLQIFPNLTILLCYLCRRHTCLLFLILWFEIIWAFFLLCWAFFIGKISGCLRISYLPTSLYRNMIGIIWSCSCTFPNHSFLQEFSEWVNFLDYLQVLHFGIIAYPYVLENLYRSL